MPAAALASPQQQPTIMMAASKPTGDTAMPSMANFTDLPLEMVEAILVDCSVVDLAQWATFCKTAKAVYRRELGREQNSRHSLALQWFGRARIMCIAALVDRYLKGEPVHPDIGANRSSICRISADGALHYEGREEYLSTPASRHYVGMAGDILIRLVFEPHSPSTMFLEVVEPSFARFDMHVSADDGIELFVDPGRDGDVRNVALVQALLTGDLPKTRADLPNPHSVLAPPFSDAAKPVELEIPVHTKSAFTHSEWLAVIAPLMPLVSRYRFVTNTVGFPGDGTAPWLAGHASKFEDHVELRGEEPHANNGIVLRGFVM